MIKGFPSLPWFAWAAIALVIAMVYSFVWPMKAVTVSSGFRFLVIRWAHSLTWLLLAINFFLRGFSPSLDGAANVIAGAGALTYLLFTVMTFVAK